MCPPFTLRLPVTNAVFLTSKLPAANALPVAALTTNLSSSTLRLPVIKVVLLTSNVPAGFASPFAVVTTTLPSLTLRLLVTNGVPATSKLPALATLPDAAVTTNFPPLTLRLPVTNAVLNGIEVPTFMNLSTLAVKAVGTLLVVAGGMPVGAQGPFSHVGAIVGGQVCYLTRAFTARVSTGCMSKTTAEKMRLAQFFNRATQLRTFVASGTAAGIAATFNTPITGVLFVHAESAAFWSKRASVRVFLCSMTVALCTSWWRNNFTGTMVGHLMLWNYSQGHWELLELFNFVAMGVVGGLLGAAVCRVHAAVDSARFHPAIVSLRCILILLSLMMSGT